jgi:hypothetical protein
MPEEDWTMADDDEDGCEDSCTGALLAGPDAGEEYDGSALGPCCGCGEEGPTVRNILMLEQKSPIAGHGWGCVVCGLPPDGATAVLCDDCLAQEAELIWACRGYAATEGRVGIESLTGQHRHDPGAHGLEAAPDAR